MLVLHHANIDCNTKSSTRNSHIHVSILLRPIIQINIPSYTKSTYTSTCSINPPFRGLTLSLHEHRAWTLSYRREYIIFVFDSLDIRNRFYSVEVSQALVARLTRVRFTVGPHLLLHILLSMTKLEVGSIDKPLVSHRCESKYLFCVTKGTPLSFRNYS